jgi:hypothetical protein
LVGVGPQAPLHKAFLKFLPKEQRHVVPSMNSTLMPLFVINKDLKSKRASVSSLTFPTRYYAKKQNVSIVTTYGDEN